MRRQRTAVDVAGVRHRAGVFRWAVRPQAMVRHGLVAQARAPPPSAGVAGEVEATVLVVLGGRHTLLHSGSLGRDIRGDPRCDLLPALSACQVAITACPRSLSPRVRQLHAAVERRERRRGCAARRRSCRCFSSTPVPEPLRCRCLLVGGRAVDLLLHAAIPAPAEWAGFGGPLRLRPAQTREGRCFVVHAPSVPELSWAALGLRHGLLSGHRAGCDCRFSRSRRVAAACWWAGVQYTCSFTPR